MKRKKRREMREKAIKDENEREPEIKKEKK